MSPPEGHRERLRTRFVNEPASLTETETLELLLTYAIPRKDVVPLAESLLNRFGSIQATIRATFDELLTIDGIGEGVATFLRLMGMITQPQTDMPDNPQLKLFDLGSNLETSKKKIVVPKEPKMRVFTSDEVANSLDLLPQAGQFHSLEEFKSFLSERLPYNASETRVRRALNILQRFYPDGEINNSLTYFAAKCSSQADLKPVVFYHVLKAEPLVAKIAEELVWPALPLGRIERDQIYEFALQYLPNLKPTSLKKIFESLSHTYGLTGVGKVDQKSISFQLHQGTLESFLNILTSEFPNPGMYSFEALYNSPLHHWLLWDREWMRLQLYNLQDYGVITKVSEIDTLRQFSLAVEQSAALRQFFEHPDRSNLAIRETPDDQGQEN